MGKQFIYKERTLKKDGNIVIVIQCNDKLIEAEFEEGSDTANFVNIYYVGETTFDYLIEGWKRVDYKEIESLEW